MSSVSQRMVRSWLCLLAAATCVYAVREKASTKNRNSVGPCILNRCPDGFLCDNGQCLPDMTKMEKIGVCVNMLCPDTYFCHNDSCLRLIPKKREGSQPIGPCINLQCPEKHICEKNDYKCYPSA